MRPSLMILPLALAILACGGSSDSTGPGTTGGERTQVDLNTVVTDFFSLLEHQFEVGKIKVRRELSDSPVLVSAQVRTTSFRWVPAANAVGAG